MSQAKYFAADDSEKCAGVLLHRMDTWCTILESTGFLDKLRMSWAAYYGAYYTDISSGHQITFSGTQGEITNLPVNHLRNIAQHVHIMTCSARPSMQARATNTDAKSLSQAYLANGLLDYYMREKRMETYLKRAVECAIVLGAGFIKMAWNATSGQQVDFNEETKSYIYEGDVEFANLSPFDVITDNSKEDVSMVDWYLCRTWKNKFDVAAKYPELHDKIMAIPTKMESYRYRLSMTALDDTDDIAIYEFFHKRTEALPDGRYQMFVSDDCVLQDTPLPYRSLPIYRISPSDIMGTPHGYTNIFDLMPLQEAINSLYSTILSNQNAFGVQNILVPRGSDISIGELTGGLNIIECNFALGKPEALNLTNTPPEVFKFIEMLKNDMETISGVNSVARGNPEASLKSGNALALIQSMAIQFASGLQQSYVELIEDVGTGLINMLRDFAAVPRVAAIVGKGNRSFMTDFKGDDLANVNRVVVEVGNPLAKTTAGRVQMAEQMLQMGAIKDPQQYFTVMNTGTLDVMTEGTQWQMILIKDENEAMMKGEGVAVIDIDDHKNHIIEHSSILASQDLRRNPELVKLVLGHIQLHIEALQQTDPDLLKLLGQQPLQPQGQAPGPQGPPSPMQGSPQPADAPPTMNVHNMPHPGQPPNPNSPQGQGLPTPPPLPGAPNQHLPSLPRVPASQLTNPSLQQAQLGNVNNRK